MTNDDFLNKSELDGETERGARKEEMSRDIG